MEKVNASPPIVAITKSNTTVYDPPLVGIRVGTAAGNINVRSGGQDVVIVGAQVGETIPCSINMVYDTDTTATGLNGYQWREG